VAVEEKAMISLEDCLALCDLTEAEVMAIAEHEGIPEMAALAYGEYLLHRAHGAEAICKMIVDDIRVAQARGDKAHVQTLLHVLHHFIKNHPQAAPAVHPWSRVR
jgi:S-ribosylhomocysteine lyase LuxS involved in autoinducer biosynthesis